MTENAARLNDVLLTMAAVDELRHRERELHQHSDTETERATLRDRLRDVYAQQGVAVPDAILDEAIAAHFEDRFAYRAPDESFAARLARVYVDRGRWLRRAALAASVALLLSAGYGAGVVYPEHLRARAEIASVNEVLSEDTRRHGELTARLAHAENLPALPAPLPELVAPALRRMDADRVVRLGEAGRLLRSLNPDALPAPLTSETLAERGVRVREAAFAFQGKLGEALHALEAADALAQDATALLRLVDTVASAKADSRITAYPGALAVQRKTLLEILDDRLRDGDVAGVEQGLAQLSALESDAQTLSSLLREAMQLHQNATEVATTSVRGVLKEALAAFTVSREAGDVPQAKQAFDRLKSLCAVVLADVTFRIVSEPGERSGVWRVPDDNPRAKNYYLIVDALRDGKPYPLDITSQEDGSVRTVSRFGVRVTDARFEQVRADKSADGIVDDKQLGHKPKGHLEPQFAEGVLGGYIHHW